MAAGLEATVVIEGDRWRRLNVPWASFGSRPAYPDMRVLFLQGFSPDVDYRASDAVVWGITSAEAIIEGLRTPTCSAEHRGGPSRL